MWSISLPKTPSTAPNALPSASALLSTSHPLTERVVHTLRERNLRLVLAESCTSGWLAASLGTVPGVSAWFCGSSVTYREDTKIRWLGVSDEVLREQSAVSALTTQAMARGVLRRTPEADLGLAITGHLGPGAPPRWDGQIYLCLAIRTSSHGSFALFQHGCRLSGDLRTERQREAAERAWTFLLRSLGDA